MSYSRYQILILKILWKLFLRNCPWSEEDHALDREISAFIKHAAKNSVEEIRK